MKYWPPIVVFAGVCGWMLLSAKVPTGEEDRYSILHGEQFGEAMMGVNDLVKDPIDNYNSGMDLSDDQIESLEEGVKLLEKIVAFDPVQYINVWTLAKAQQALGDNEAAVRSYEQALVLVPLGVRNERSIELAADIQYDYGVYCYKLGLMERAEELLAPVAASHSNNVKYLTALAVVKVQLKKFDEANELIDTALFFDNENPTALTLKEEVERTQQNP